MSMDGGYKIINLKDVPLQQGVSVKIKGIHEKIESNHRKAYLLSGLTIAGAEKADVFKELTMSNNTFIFADVYGNPLTIDSEDNVTWGSSDEENPEGTTPVLAQ